MDRNVSNLAIAILGLFLLGLAGCGEEEKTPDRDAARRGNGPSVAARGAAERVAAARARIRGLDVEETARERAAGTTVVDLRETEERLTHGAIPGAIHVPRGVLEFWADSKSPAHKPVFDPGRRYVLHCASGSRSALATALLEDMGYTDVMHLEGGFKAWKEAGKPVETVEPPAAPGGAKADK